MTKITLAEIDQQVHGVEDWASDLVDYGSINHLADDYHQLIKQHANGCNYAVLGNPTETDELLVFFPGFGGRLALNVLWKTDLVRAYGREMGQEVAVLILDIPFEHDQDVFKSSQPTMLNSMYKEIIEEQQAKKYTLVGYSQGAVLALTMVDQLSDHPDRVICLDPSSLKKRPFLQMVFTFLTPSTIRSWNTARKQWRVYSKIERVAKKDAKTKHYYGYFRKFIWGFSKKNQRDLTRFMLRDHTQLLVNTAKKHKTSLIIGGRSSFSPDLGQIRTLKDIDDLTTFVSDADHGSFHRASVLPWAVFNNE